MPHGSRDPSQYWSNFVKNYTRLVANGPSHGASIHLANAANVVLPFSKASGILEVGCGGGQLVTDILEKHSTALPENARIIASDFVEGMVNIVVDLKKSRISQGDAVWNRLEPVVIDAMDLSRFGDGSFSHVLGGLVYGNLPDPAKGLNEAHRVLEHSGIVGLTSILSAEWMDLFSAINEIRPDLPPTPKVKTIAPTWCEAQQVRGHLEKAGFRDVSVHEFPVVWKFDTYDKARADLFDALPFVGTWFEKMTEEEIEKTKDRAVERMKEMYPTEPNALRGTAVLAIGRK
ncbi:hypothetical protein FQN50_003806 [Emmonsiellopsis sp. PD_5]|nr:hypothetical protein FQN50_003806 [Emmonsiellopsis sp. PD_5]